MGDFIEVFYIVIQSGLMVYFHYDKLTNIVNLKLYNNYILEPILKQKKNLEKSTSTELET